MTYLIKPRQYQIDAMKFIYRRKRVGLFFEMGTGKTKICVDFLAVMFQAEKIQKALIIAPLSGLGVWEDEIKKNAPQIQYQFMRPGFVDWDISHRQVIIVNYDYMRTHVQWLIGWHPDVVILDESHKIKNPYARQSKTAHKLGQICDYAICLTVTPIGNKPLDLWSQMKFLDSSVLDKTFKQFKEHYAVWIGYGRFQLKCYKNLKELGQRISPYIKTLKKADYLGLPPKNFITVPVELDSNCREAYKSMEKDFILSLKDKNIIAPIVLAKLTKLCEITGGFITDNEGKDILLGTHKLDALLDLCNNLQESGVNRVVIYARFLWEINQIRDILGRKWTTYRISGEVKQPDRVLAERLFNNDGGVIICQIASGSIAINLQSAHHTIYYSLDYSLTNYLQS